MAKTRKSSYVPVPKADAETQQRLNVVLLEVTHQLKATEAAELLRLSRLHYHSLRNRGLQAMVDALTPGLPGRPASDPKLRELKERVRDLEDENERLQIQAERNEQLIRGLTETIKELSATSRVPRRPRTSRKTATSGGDDDGETHRRGLLEREEELVTRGLNRQLAAQAVQRDPATLRRWRARRNEGRLLARRRGPVNHTPICPTAERRVADHVRQTRGLVGAEALHRREPLVSRRRAARIKHDTLLAMERERVESAVRIHIATPGIVRGLDQLWVRTDERMRCVLVLADGAVPYRTSIETIERYTGECVAALLESDIERHGAPLVLRLDRAKAHDVPAVHDVCARHGVLVLHGPPRRPQYYGQLERQNREHRAWLDACGTLHHDELDDELARMRPALNGLWPRRTLGWSTPEVLWNCRRTPSVDRAALRERVAATSIRLAEKLPPKALALGTHHRLAIEHELAALGLLERQPGGWC